jgi:hypothetical protein
MIKVIVSGRLGNQFFYYALFKHLINQGFNALLVGDVRAINTLLKEKLKENKDYKIPLSLKILDFSYSKIKYSFLWYLSRIMYYSILYIEKSFFLLISELSTYNSKLLSFTKSGVWNENDLQKKYTNFYSTPWNIYRKSTLIGYWQSNELANIISLNDIELPYKYKQEYLTLTKSINYDNSIAIHVRGEDYLRDNNLDILDQEYYEKAINYFSDFLPTTNFYIFYDDEFPVKNKILTIKNLSSIILVSEKTNSDILDFFIMKNFRYFIIANSTFSWWASKLSCQKGKIVVRPKQFSKNKYDNLINESSIIL